MNHKGHTLLETAVVIPLILGVVLAAVDVNNFLRSQQAMQEAVRTALRCSYVVNGECVEANAMNVSARYEAFIGTPEVEQAVDHFRFSFRERMLEGPELGATGFTARVFNDVRYRYGYHTHEAVRRYFPGTGFTDGGGVPVMRGYPYILGPNADAMSVRWRINQDLHFNAINAANVPSSAMTPGADYSPIGVFSFGYGSRFNFDPEACRVSQDFGRRTADHEPNDNRLCLGMGITPDGGGHLAASPPANTIPAAQQNFPFNGHHFSAVLDVRGSSGGSSDGARATVDIRLVEVRDPDNGQQFSRHVDLGGRDFTSAAGERGASLFPRGSVLPSHIHPDSPDAQEFGLHAGKVAIRPGSRYEVHARLRTTSGTPQWRPTAVRLYLPRVVGNGSGAQQFECDGGLTPSQSQDPANCVAGNLVATELEFFPEEPPVRQDLVALGYSAHGDIDFVSALQDHLFANGQGGSANPDVIAQDWVHESAETVTAQRTANCSANFGAPGLAGVNHVVDNAAAAAACPPPSPQSLGLPAEAALLDGYTHTVRNQQISVPTGELPRWPKPDCSGSSSVPADLVPAVVQQYGTWSVNGIQQTGRTVQRFGAAVDPNDLVETAAYNCGEFSVAHGAVRPNTADKAELDPGAFVLGAHPGPYCESEFLSLVRPHAIEELEYDNDAFLVVEQAYAYSRELAAGQHSFPSSCTEIRERILGILDRELLGEYLASELPPAQCQEPGAHCTYSFVGVDNLGGDAFEVQTAAAAQMGLTEMRMINPRARTDVDCSGTNCFSMTVEQGAGDQIVAQATGSITSRVLLGREVPLSYQETARWEGFFAR